MESVTDIIFRQVVAKAARPDVFFTEFTNVSSFASEKGRHNALERLVIVPTDAPIIAQLWGTNPDHFAYTAKHLPEGFSGIDINMGCPDKHVVKNGGGSALIKAPHETSAGLISAVKDNTDLPVSVKTRLGYSRVDEWQGWLTHLLEQDLAALTIHLRTKKEMSKVPAHHELIPEVLKLAQSVAPNTTIILNGDFTSRTHFNQLFKCPSQKTTGCMIGRGVFTNPFCFEKSPREHTKKELMELLLYHLDLFDSSNLPSSFSEDFVKSPVRTTTYIPDGTEGFARSEVPSDAQRMRSSAESGSEEKSVRKFAAEEPEFSPRKFEPLKRFFKIYINNFEGAADIRARLMETKTTSEVRHIISTIQ